MAVDVDLKMDVGTGREPGRSHQPDHLTRRHSVSCADLKFRQMAVNDPRVVVDDNHDVVACAQRVIPDKRRAWGR